MDSRHKVYCCNRWALYWRVYNGPCIHVLGSLTLQKLCARKEDKNNKSLYKVHINSVRLFSVLPCTVLLLSPALISSGSSLTHSDGRKWVVQIIALMRTEMNVTLRASLFPSTRCKSNSYFGALIPQCISRKVSFAKRDYKKKLFLTLIRVNFQLQIWLFLHKIILRQLIQLYQLVKEQHQQ
jgi:hypothetical protein